MTPPSYLHKLESHDIRIGTIYNHGDGIIESIVEEGVEVNTDDMQELFALLEQITPRPKGLVADRRNHYSFTFNAMFMASRSKHIEAVAEITYGRITMFGDLFWPKFFKLAFFGNRDKAFEWLKRKID